MLDNNFIVHISKSILVSFSLLLISVVFSVRNVHAQVQILPTLPKPQNVQGFVDDRVATITWTEPANTQSNNIVGYLVRWGKVGESLTGMKQTIYASTQIQPLVNGSAYTVTVQSVQGSMVTRSNGGHLDGPDTYAVANGKLSDPVVITVTPSSARVDAMRNRLTGFFDDMNIPTGPFSELLWNHGSTACVELGEDGQFINGQYHGHNMTRSTCDRDGSISRPRAILDVTGKTEANPAQIEFDFDGVSQPRDVWYVDIIPADARKNGMPLDVTSHNDAFDGDHEDPGRMIRVVAYYDKIGFHGYDANNNSFAIPLTPGPACSQGYPAPDFLVLADWECNMTVKTSGFSPLAQSTAPLGTVPNVRRHWVIQFSPQKIKLFIDSTLVATANTPALFANINKYQLHWTIFSYNTGKQFNTVMPTSMMVHWDNFGFTGPVPTTEVHNYLDGGQDGDFPLYARGVPGHEVPSGNRTTKIPIPDPIANPVQARLMFTIQPFGYQYYTWNQTHKVTVNGHVYNFPDPRQNIQSQNITSIAETYIAHSTGISINPADLVTGLNTIAFSLGGTDILNAHIELEYNKNNAPVYSSPRTIFSNTINSVVAPMMRANDMYWFVEQTMGLETLMTSPTPVPTPQPVIGDVNNDGVIDSLDLKTVLSNYGANNGSNCSTRPTGDIAPYPTSDCKVNILDAGYVIANFGKMVAMQAMGH